MDVTPDILEAQANEEDARGDELTHQVRKHREKARLLRLTAAKLREILTEASLTLAGPRSKLSGMTPAKPLDDERPYVLNREIKRRPGDWTARNLRVSKRLNAENQDPFLAALNAKGFTLRSYAAHIGCSRTKVYLWRAKVRPAPISRAEAEQVERDVGYAAIPANWPGGIKG